jgi:hypothetical protein
MLVPLCVSQAFKQFGIKVLFPLHYTSIPPIV